MPNDDINSLMVPFGMSIELYAEWSWTGESRTYSGAMFSEFNQRMKCIDVGDFKDKTTSLIVYRSRNFGEAVGKWEPVMTTSYQVSALVHYGIIFGNSTRQDEQWVLNYEMRKGVTFDSTPIDETFLEEIRDDVASFYSHNSG